MDQEFEKFEIILECIDSNMFAPNVMIGYHSIGISTLYNSASHEFYNSWLALYVSEVKSKIQGYLLVSCYLVGANDSPPVHKISENVYYEEEPDEVA